MYVYTMYVYAIFIYSAFISHFCAHPPRRLYFGPFRAHHSAFCAYLPISTHRWCVRHYPPATTQHWFTHCTSLNTCDVSVVPHRSAQSSVDQLSLWQLCANVIFSFCIDRNSIECLLPCLPLVTFAVVVIIFRYFYFK